MPARTLGSLSASWWLSRFGPLAPHFGQTPWNKLARSLRILPRSFRQNGQSLALAICQPAVGSPIGDIRSIDSVVGRAPPSFGIREVQHKGEGCCTLQTRVLD
jgi:hypothetical protein